MKAKKRKKVSRIRTPKDLKSWSSLALIMTEVIKNLLSITDSIHNLPLS
jgi:hypothetical protein